ncbi:MAG: ribose-phosphate pyrophosphokinase [Syntrophobacteraceae bacterium]|jgi:ribose-phosphate pyrophosphokinase|nr:ribose-phosphate pyrophosphokinase [Syntrophobacteraceae bacterium]
MLGALRVFCCNSNPSLAWKVASLLDMEVSQALVGRFSDGEVRVEIHENVRGMDVFVLQSISPPVNDNLLELLVMVDALKRASAGRINVVVPYYGYGRQDQKEKPRVPIAAKVVADLLTGAGADRLVTIDLHSEQIQGFFRVPVDHLSATEVLLEDLRLRLEGDEIVVAPDANGVPRARSFADRLKVDLAIMDYRRTGGEPYVQIVGNVKGRRVVILDDMINTGRTLERTAQSALLAGAASVEAYGVHAILSENATKRLDGSSLSLVTVTDSVALPAGSLSSRVVRSVSIAPLLAEAVRRIHYEESLSAMFLKMC